MTLVEGFDAAPERSVRQVVSTIRARACDATGQARGRLRPMRQLLACALLLVAILACTGLLVWLCWHAAGDARLRPADPQGREAARLETSLLADQRQERSTLRKATPVAGTGAAPTAPRGQDSATVPAPVMASAGSAAAVAAGAVAVLVVLRRFRRRREEEALGVPLQPVCAEGEQDERTAEPEPVNEHAQPEPDHETTAADGAVETAQPTWARVGLLEAPAVVPLRLRGFGDAGAAASGSRDEHRLSVEGQRVFERRAVPRVDYAQDAVLVLGEQQWAVRTLNLSEKGLGCRSVAPAAGAAASLPKPRANVTVLLPVDGAVVELRAQVVWRRRTSAGQEAGLTFSGPDEDALQLLRRTCAALVPVQR